jgi:hypothetical protein
VHPTRAPHRWLLISLIGAAIAAPGVSGARSAQPKSAKPPSPVVVEVRRGGFHWGDAGVGAAAALAIVAIAVGVALILRERRDGPPAPDAR